MAVAKKYQGQPVALVAVNSGSSLSKVSNYAKQNRITIPIIADLDRSLERSAQITTEISLKNIYQARILKADGTTIRTSPVELDAAMQKAADGAAWNINPTDIPDSMQPLWQAIEFGGYAPVAKQLSKMMKSRKSAEKAAAGKLNDYIYKQLETQLAAAEANVEPKPWTARKQLTDIKTRFKGYKVPGSVQKNLDSLNDTDAIKSELAAIKQLKLAQKAANGNASAQKRAIRTLHKLIDTYPDTEAAETAKALLESAQPTDD